jgi:hypothetical protein
MRRILLHLLIGAVPGVLFGLLPLLVGGMLYLKKKHLGILVLSIAFFFLTIISSMVLGLLGACPTALIGTSAVLLMGYLNKMFD